MKPRITSLHVRPKPPELPPIFKFCAVYRDANGKTIVHKVNNEDQLKRMAATRWEFAATAQPMWWANRKCRNHREAIWKAVIQENSFFFEHRFEAQNFSKQFDLDMDAVAISTSPAEPVQAPAPVEQRPREGRPLLPRRGSALDGLYMPELIRRDVAGMHFFRRNVANNRVWYHDGRNFEEEGYPWYVTYSGMGGEEHFRFVRETDATGFAMAVNSRVLSSRPRYP